jgi:hypothetical protein
VLAILGEKRILRKCGDIVAIQCSKTIIYCNRYAVTGLNPGIGFLCVEQEFYRPADEPG